MQKIKARSHLNTAVVLGADHAGFAVKEFIKIFLQKSGYRVQDVGAFRRKKQDDYPDFAEKLALEIRQDKAKRGILACGTGIGACIAANKIPGIRAALACNAQDARLSTEHNNANILVLGGRPFSRGKAKKMVKAFLGSRFLGGRHSRRIKKIMLLEGKYA